ncbi:hypothetical protein CTAYLR_007743 [Chrysophaeum taylorii]|uniref:MORN repeat-containing protein 5 n=1 Tax=Chrysophaeum taylorii TaxID=2483200 RepID=A0AAD7UCP1_9STRA|nr:hypothetical protein CTAYLR_007743 [Chrysophaeum taylorii]
MSYDGPLVFGRYEGQGVYRYPDGTRYEGAFKNGAFHGPGKLVFENGVFEGVFKNGREITGAYIFNDGLKYEDNWGYLLPGDRRFHSEHETGIINPAGALSSTNDPKLSSRRNSLPPGCYDVGGGEYYDPRTGYVHDIVTKSKRRQPPDAERQWIEGRCRMAGP